MFIHNGINIINMVEHVFAINVPYIITIFPNIRIIVPWFWKALNFENVTKKLIMEYVYYILLKCNFGVKLLVEAISLMK